MKTADMIGLRFGRWVVVGTAPHRKGGDPRVSAVCDCGTTRCIDAFSVRRGQSLSCGCMAFEMTAARTTHGSARKGRKSPEYWTWRAMKGRCTVPNNHAWDRYGGRGIRVCDRWLNDFPAFLADMGPKTSPKHSIERKNNDGNYEPSNCVWATPIEQARNKSSVKLTEEKAAEIRIRIGAGECPAVVAKDYGISSGHARNVGVGLSWAAPSPNRDKPADAPEGIRP